MKKLFKDYLESIKSNSNIMKSAYNTIETEIETKNKLKELKKEQERIENEKFNIEFWRKIKTQRINEVNEVLLKQPDSKLDLSNLKLTDEELESLILNNRNINFNKIIELNLSGNIITDISGIGIFKNLKILSLRSNVRLKDINVLKNLNKLEDLDMQNISNTVDLSVFKYLTNLKTLNINCESSLEDIKYLKNLTELYIAWTEVKDISFIPSLKKLNRLVFNQIRGLPFEQLNYINKSKSLKWFTWGGISFGNQDTLKGVIKKSITVYTGP